MLMNIHHRLRSGVINNRRYKIRFFEQLPFPVIPVLADRHGSFIFVTFQFIFFMQPVIILINRFIYKTKRRCLSKTRTTNQHHINGRTGLPFSFYADMTRITYRSSNGRKDNRNCIFHIEILVSGKI